MDDIVRDSSVWQDRNAMAAVNNKDYSLRVGMVRDITNLNTSGIIKYIVEVYSSNQQIPVTCDVMNRFGGVWNYEEYTHQNYVHGNNNASIGYYQYRPGDTVLVAALNGDWREGIILGGLQHPGRAPALTLADGVAYQSAFNGLVTSIEDDGSYTVTFNGAATNGAALQKPPNGAPIPAPTYDPSIAGSFYGFAADGSFTVGDAAQSNPQSININKPAGTLTVTAGPVILALDKNAQSATLTTQSTVVNSSKSIAATTGTYSMKAQTSASIQSPAVAIGTSSVELLAQLAMLIDKLGAVTPISPVGPCTPLMATGQWADVMAVQAKIKSITGSF